QAPVGSHNGRGMVLAPAEPNVCSIERAVKEKVHLISPAGWIPLAASPRQCGPPGASRFPSSFSLWPLVVPQQ
ncbi:MAG: hypothetical protein ACREA1_08445, partial [Nitrosotalea sp.]